MKNVIVATIAMFFAYAATAQVPVPDFKNQPMLLKDGKLVKLEKQSAEIKNQRHGYSFGASVTSDLHLDGAKSDVRTGAKPEFVIKVDAEVDPETLFYLAVTLPAKKGRDIELSKQAVIGNGKSVKRFHLKLNYEKVSDGVYKITVGEPLEDGEEYAFVNSAQGSLNGSNTTTYAFGVGK